MKRIVFVILAISVLLAFPLAAALAQSGCAARHTVQFGENLFRIGLKYGLAWTVLQSANGLTNPNHIFVGQVLCIPAILPPVTFPPARTATPTIPAQSRSRPEQTCSGTDPPSWSAPRPRSRSARRLPRAPLRAGAGADRRSPPRAGPPGACRRAPRARSPAPARPPGRRR